MADIDEEAFMSSLGEEGEGSSSGSRDRRGCWYKSFFAANMLLAICMLPSIYALMMFLTFRFNGEAPEFSVHLAGYDGLVPLPPDNNATAAMAATVVSPVFSLKVHIDNPARHVHVLMRPWCYTGGEVVVSYSGVALAWAHVPRFCIDSRLMPPPTTTELFRVYPLGRGAGLSEDLGRRLASELHQGTAQVTATMKILYQDKNYSPSRKYDGPLLKSFQLMLH